MTLLRPASWTGRTDGPGHDHRRWHSIVQTSPALFALVPKGKRVGLVGFASDEGVRRNGGRTGAAAAPTALRTALANLALHEDLDVVDLGDVAVQDGDLEHGQQQLGGHVAALIQDRRLPVVLGGGHETAYGTYQGLASSGLVAGRRLGIVNLDAHFDLRTADVATSGTPFLQIARDRASSDETFHYLVLGLSRSSNTAALFATANELDVDYRLDEDCQELQDGGVLTDLTRFVEGVDAIHLTVDLDVLPAATAPGVSAPAALGVPLGVVLAVCRAVAESGKLAVADITELNPHHDIDNRTARAAARIAHTIATAGTPLNAS